MAVREIRRATATIAAAIIFTFGLAGAATAEEIPASPIGVDTEFSCYQCHGKKEITPWIAMTWSESKHARGGVKCDSCHGNHDKGFDSGEFTPLPGPEKCAPCHPINVKQTLAGKHAGLVKCSSCHPRHTFSLEVAQDPLICMTCHLESKHVQGYRNSKMGAVYRVLGPGMSATCVTCHMPDGEHNVSLTLKNPELMLKVCNQCHSGAFAGEVLKTGKFNLHW
ncbi:MAG: cytochrome c3 family protein [Nitrospirae bacterium]|nr:cytochrome c3 family protein [Nitrospirota bacterium]